MLSSSSSSSSSSSIAAAKLWALRLLDDMRPHLRSLDRPLRIVVLALQVSTELLSESVLVESWAEGRSVDELFVPVSTAS